jgi:hypothetical protein
MLGICTDGVVGSYPRKTSCNDEHWLELVYSGWVWCYEVEPACYCAVNLGQLSKGYCVAEGVTLIPQNDLKRVVSVRTPSYIFPNSCI